MILVADSAPLIFLSKINQLNLLHQILNPEILIPSAVSKEILGTGIPPDEERLLTTFLSGGRVVNIRKPIPFAKALSFADNCILTLATTEHVDIVSADDRLLRKTSVIEGFHVIGTVGILLRATRAALVTPKDSLRLLHELVEEHNFRISTSVFEVARRAISAIEGKSRN